MAFGSIKTVYRMLKKYGKQSVFSKSFFIIFASFFVFITSTVFLIQHFYDKSEDKRNVEMMMHELYLSRNKLDGILNTINKTSANLKKNEKITEFINGTETEETDVLETLEDKKRAVSFLNSIYIYIPERDYVVSTSRIYKSDTINNFVDISWLDTYKRGKRFFYREYPDIGTIVKCISYCEDITTEKGEKAVIIYNVEHAKANMDSSLFSKGTLFMIDENSDIIYSSNMEIIGRNAEEYIGKFPSYSDMSTYLSKYDSFRKILLGIKLKKNTTRLVLAMNKSWTKNVIYSPSILFIIVLLTAFASVILAFLITARMYRPLMKMFNFINKGVAESGGKNEITDVMEYIIDLDNRKNIAENELTQQVMLLQHAQVIALQSQLNPHFLFNTLQLVNSVIFAEVKRDTEATQIISILSSLLREALDTTEFCRTLREEIYFTEKYIEIQKIRYQGAFEIEWNIAEETKELMVPKCVLQPIIENSIAYGILMLEDGGKIRVKSYIENNLLKISVWDNGVGFEESKLHEIRELLRDKRVERKEKIGLCNINQRIKILFGVEYGIEIISEGNGTEIIINIPPKSKIM